jgi:hypothetical protein
MNPICHRLHPKLKNVPLTSYWLNFRFVAIGTILNAFKFLKHPNTQSLFEE